MEILSCPNGHVVGVLNAGNLTIKHRGRTVTVDADGTVQVTIVCEKCKGAVKVRLGEDKKEDVYETIQETENGNV